MAFTQENTLLQVTTPFGADAVLATRVHVEERLSALFVIRVDLLAPSSDLSFAKVLGQSITVKLKLSNNKFRYFNGVVTRFSQSGRVGNSVAYSAELVPKAWRLSKKTDSRIFQNQTVPEIAKAILSEHGVDAIKDELKRSYDKREYCVQFQETDLDFICRLFEDEGIFYYFRHEDAKHVLVLGDHPAAHAQCDVTSEVKCRGEVASSLADEDIVIACDIDQELTVGGYSVSDYNFELPPSTSLLAKVEGADPKLEVYEYPGNHSTKSEGENRAKLRLEAEESHGKMVSGTSYVRSFSAGRVFSLSGHERKDANREYVVLSVTHSASGDDYSNSFQAFPKSVAFRPPRITHRPVIIGLQTAVVTGKSGEEIWTDKYGRIKVQFHWDRRGKRDENSSCWIRVAQGWAGKGWGAFFLPRIGQEVVVSFLGGDPDRPLVTGSVHNANQMVPYSLPSEQTKSTILSRSSKDGSEGNEIRFEDKKDSEEVFVHAQKDMNVTINHDQTVKIDNNQTSTIKKNRDTTLTEGDDTLTIEEGNRTIAVKKGDETHSVKGKREISVESEENHKTHGAFTHHGEDKYTIKVDGDLVIDVKGKITIKAGQSYEAKAGTSVKVEAGTELTNKAGTELNNKAGTNLTNEAQVSLSNKGSAMQTVDGGGMLTLKGGLVKIN